MGFKWYGKIHRLWKEETEWILSWVCTIQEKIDGANLSIWMENDWIHVGSRTQDVTTKWFRGAVEYVHSHEWIVNYLSIYKWHRLYGEWLVKHTIWNYNPNAYNHFYLFDVEDYNGDRLTPEDVSSIANKYNIKTPQVIATIYRPTYPQIEEVVWKSWIWPVGEGVVIKNMNFINMFGDMVYAKVVSDKFKEDNQIVFGSDSNHDVELKLVSKFINEGRVRKIINKIEQNEDRIIQNSDINKIIWITYYDFISEEISTIAKMWVIDFNKLAKLANKKIAYLSLEIIP